MQLILNIFESCYFLIGWLLAGTLIVWLAYLPQTRGYMWPVIILFVAALMNTIDAEPARQFIQSTIHWIENTNLIGN